MSLKYLNPEVTFSSVALNRATASSMVFLCEACLKSYGFRKDDFLRDDAKCFIDGCIKKAFYISYIQPEFLDGFEHHELL